MRGVQLRFLSLRRLRVLARSAFSLSLGRFCVIGKELDLALLAIIALLFAELLARTLMGPSLVPMAAA